MIFERIPSEGLAHYSYLVGDAGEALVIDPRRDCEIYVEKASRNGFRIAHILETHRNEDYLIGSTELAARTEAEIWHADSQFQYQYGRAVEDGQSWQVGRLKIQALHTPGHTPGSMSYLLHDLSGAPWVIFSGDALFAGDVGRADLMGMDRAEEMSNALYDTIFDKLLPLGDGVILCPAHGFGSVCAGAIAERVWTSLGLERQLNPKLQVTNREEFVANVAEELERPPYFRCMEAWNVETPPPLGPLPAPPPLSAALFEQRIADGIVVDARSPAAFGVAHVPGALSIWLEGLPSFAGWFIPYDRPILLVLEGDDPTPAVRYLLRLGYDHIAGYLSGGMLAWHTSGQGSASIATVAVQQLCHHLDAGRPAWILDVRSGEELQTEGRITGAHPIHITQLPHHFEEVPVDEPVYIFCGSGLRSMIAASLLRRAGRENARVVLGGITGWNSSTCPVEL